MPALLGELPLPPDFLPSLPTFIVRQEQVLHCSKRDVGHGWPTFVQKRPSISTYSLPGDVTPAAPGESPSKPRGR